VGQKTNTILNNARAQICSMRDFSYRLCGSIAERNFSTENSLVRSFITLE